MTFRRVAAATAVSILAAGGALAGLATPAHADTAWEFKGMTGTQDTAWE